MNDYRFLRIAASILLIFCASTLFTGCAGLPKRDLTAMAPYTDLRGDEYVDRKPIRSEYQDLADEVAAGGSTNAHKLVLLDVGDDALLARIHLVRAARETIDLQTYIWGDDEVSRSFFNELVNAAKRGVKVRMLVDGLPSMGDARSIAKLALAHENIDICIFRPLSWKAVTGALEYTDNFIFRFKRMNRRMHNKLFIVDNRIAILGGRNYEGKYYDRYPSFLFKDREAVVMGAAVRQMSEAFNTFWHEQNAVFLPQFHDVRAEIERVDSKAPIATEEDLESIADLTPIAGEYSLAGIRPKMKIWDIDRIEYVADLPTKFRRRLVRKVDYTDQKMDEILRRAQERIVFQTPYLIYSRSMKRFFKRIRKEYPNLRIVAISNSFAAADHTIAYALSYKHRKQLFAKSGIDIYEFKPVPHDVEIFCPRYPLLNKLPPDEYEQYVIDGNIAPIEKSGPRMCIHIKSFTVDGRIAQIGSHNFDPRSSKLNTENAIIIYDEEFASFLEGRMLRDTEPGNAWMVGKREHTGWSNVNRFFGSIFAYIPFLDIWPYRYATNYELIEGKEPMTARDPAFIDNYRDVGQFPEVDSSTSKIQARMMKGFFGWTRPLM
jgi:phosphatidylserine/phosphatidylglycerophosphate/cardiolipin synthase-like enzyme